MRGPGPECDPGPRISDRVQTPAQDRSYGSATRCGDSVARIGRSCRVLVWPMGPEKLIRSLGLLHSGGESLGLARPAARCRCEIHNLRTRRPLWLFSGQHCGTEVRSAWAARKPSGFVRDARLTTWGSQASRVPKAGPRGRIVHNGFSSQELQTLGSFPGQFPARSSPSEDVTQSRASERGTRVVSAARDGQNDVLQDPSRDGKRARRGPRFGPVSGTEQPAGATGASATRGLRL